MNKCIIKGSGITIKVSTEKILQSENVRVISANDEYIKDKEIIEQTDKKTNSPLIVQSSDN